MKFSQIWSLFLLSFALIVTPLAQATGAKATEAETEDPLCRKGLQPNSAVRASIRESLEALANSRMGKSVDPDILKSLQYLNEKFAVQQNYEIVVLLEVNEKDASGTTVSLNNLLANFLAKEAKGLKGEHGSYMFSLNFSSLPALLNILRNFESSVNEITFSDPIEIGRDLIQARSRPQIREIVIPHKAIETAIGKRSPEVVLQSPVGRPSNERQYARGGQTLAIPQAPVDMLNEYGSKYDPILILGASEILADVYRLNMGAQVSAFKHISVVRPPFLLRNITGVSIHAVSVQVSPTAGIPYRVIYRVQIWGYENDIDPMSHPRHQVFTAETNFRGHYILAFPVSHGITEVKTQ